MSEDEDARVSGVSRYPVDADDSYPSSPGSMTDNEELLGRLMLKRRLEDEGKG